MRYLEQNLELILKREEFESDSPEWITARNELAEANSGLVPYVIQKLYTNNIVHNPIFEDMKQEGYFGLLLACGRVSSDMYTTFARYAELFIMKKVVSFWNETIFPLRLPTEKGRIAGKILKNARGDNSDLLPVEDVIAMFPSYSENYIRDTYRVLSLREVRIEWFNQDTLQSSPLLATDIDTVEREVEDKVGLESLYKVLDTLSELENLVLRARFGISFGSPQSYASTAKVLNIGYQKVKELEVSGFAKLVHPTRMVLLCGDWLDV